MTGDRFRDLSTDELHARTEEVLQLIVDAHSAAMHLPDGSIVIDCSMDVLRPRTPLEQEYDALMGEMKRRGLQ